MTLMGEVEWTIAKHGGRGKRRWRKLHLGVDARGVIVAQALTGDDVRDATAGLDLTDAVAGEIEKVTADIAYDTIAFYDAASARGAAVVVLPKETATIDRRGRGSKARDRTIEAIERMGRRRWKKAAGYHQQARVENTFFRYKLIVGGALRARSSAGQAVEAIVACNIPSRSRTRSAGEPA